MRTAVWFSQKTYFMEHHSGLVLVYHLLMGVEQSRGKISSDFKDLYEWKVLQKLLQNRMEYVMC